MNPIETFIDDLDDQNYYISDEELSQIYAHPVPGLKTGWLYSFLGIFFFWISGELIYTGIYTMNEVDAPAMIQREGLLFIIFSSIFIVSGLLFLRKGIQHLLLVWCFRKYCKILAGRKLITLEELSQQTHMPLLKLRKALKNMIAKNMFLQGHLNEHATCFITTDKVYQEYVRVVEQWKRRQIQLDYLGFDREAQDILTQGNTYLSEIDELANKITDTNLKGRIEQLHTAMEKIMHIAEQKPSNLASLHTFMTYFIPLSKKLLETYENLQDNPIAVANVEKMQSEIPQALTSMLDSFQKILNEYSENLSNDISADVRVLEFIMAQNKLVGAK